MTTVDVDIVDSDFTLKDLSQFLTPGDSYSSKLSVIAHIDCNCFFAQVERNRLGLEIEVPLVCVQWHSIIAVSYSARDFGISRMDKLTDAKLKCPDLVPVHTAVFKIKNDYWEYLDNQPFPSAADHKVSLDPYRRASFKILKLLKNITRYVEKASVDEWYVDLSELIYMKLIELIPEFNVDDFNEDDKLPDLNLKLENVKGLLFGLDPMIDKVTDYDDLFIILGAIITDEIRKEIFDKLQYQTSCGVSNNKKLAKLLSNYKKPNEQTILLNTKISKFLENFKLDDISSFGGKMGNELMTNFFGDQSISSIQQNFNLNTIQNSIKDEKLSLKIFKIINGCYKEPLNLNKDVIQSMNSSKNLLNGINGDTFENCKQWLKIFAIDLKQRLIEYNYELEKFDLKPKNLTVRLKPKSAGGAYNFGIISKSMPLKGLVLDSKMNEVFYEKSLELLKGLENAFVYPLVNISLTISSFDLISKQENNILQLLENGAAANSNSEGNNGAGSGEMMFVSVGKIKKKKDVMDLFRFKRGKDQGVNQEIKNEKDEVDESSIEKELEQIKDTDEQDDDLIIAESRTLISDEEKLSSEEPTTTSPIKESHEEQVQEQEQEQEQEQDTGISFENYTVSNNIVLCNLCNEEVIDVIEHNDYHYALKLSSELNEADNNADMSASGINTARNERTNSSSSRKPSNKPKLRKKRKGNDGNQSRLPF